MVWSRSLPPRTTARTAEAAERRLNTVNPRNDAITAEKESWKLFESFQLANQISSKRKKTAPITKKQVNHPLKINKTRNDDRRFCTVTRHKVRPPSSKKGVPSISFRIIATSCFYDRPQLACDCNDFWPTDPQGSTDWKCWYLCKKKLYFIESREMLIVR